MQYKTKTRSPQLQLSSKAIETTDADYKEEQKQDQEPATDDLHRKDLETKPELSTDAIITSNLERDVTQKVLHQHPKKDAVNTAPEPV